MDFLSKNKEYFSNHNFGEIPEKFIHRIGELNQSKFIKGYVTIIECIKEMYKQSEEYIYGMLPEVSLELVEAVISKIKTRSIKFNYILPEGTTNRFRTARPDFPEQPRASEPFVRRSAHSGLRRQRSRERSGPMEQMSRTEHRGPNLRCCAPCSSAPGTWTAAQSRESSLGPRIREEAAKRLDVIVVARIHRLRDHRAVEDRPSAHGYAQGEERVARCPIGAAEPEATRQKQSDYKQHDRGRQRGAELPLRAENDLQKRRQSERRNVKAERGLRSESDAARERGEEQQDAVLPSGRYAWTSVSGAGQKKSQADQEEACAVQIDIRGEYLMDDDRNAQDDDGSQHRCLRTGGETPRDHVGCDGEAGQGGNLREEHEGRQAASEKDHHRNLGIGGNREAPVGSEIDAQRAILKPSQRHRKMIGIAVPGLRKRRHRVEGKNTIAKSRDGEAGDCEARKPEVAGLRRRPSRSQHSRPNGQPADHTQESQSNLKLEILSRDSWRPEPTSSPTARSWTGRRTRSV